MMAWNATFWTLSCILQHAQLLLLARKSERFISLRFFLSCLDNFTHNNTSWINSTGPSAISFLLAYYKKKSINNSLAMPTLLPARLPIFIFLVDLVWGWMLGPTFAACFSLASFWSFTLHDLTLFCFPSLQVGLETVSEEGTGLAQRLGMAFIVVWQWGWSKWGPVLWAQLCWDSTNM